MKPETLAKIKNELNELYAVAFNIALYFEETFPQDMMVAILLQHAQFSGVNTYGYDHDEAAKKLHQIIKLIDQVAKYEKDNHFITWVSEQASIIVQGNEMSEDIESFKTI